MSPTRSALKNLCLLATLATACSYDASKLRRLATVPADGADDKPAAPFPDASDGNDDTTILPDAPTGAPDAPGELDGGGTLPSTGGVGGSGGPTDTAGTEHVPVETGGTDSSDAPIATGGTGAGGSGGLGDTAVSTGGSDAVASSAGSPSGGASGGGSTAIDSGGTNTGGMPGSGGQTNSGGSDGGGADGARDSASSGGGSGGQAGSGGSGGGGSGGSSDAGSSGGRTCSVSQCPPTATIGLTGPWGATYSNGSTGTVVSSGDAAFLNWLSTRGTGCVVQNLDISNNNYLTAARLAPYQIIIVLDLYHTQADKDAFFKAKLTNAGYPAYPGTQRTLQANEVNAVRDWVNGGGGLMTTIGTTNTAAEMANANLLLNPFGIAHSVTDVNILSGNSTVTAFATTAPIASRITAGVATLRVAGAVGIEGLAGGNLPNNSNTFSLYATSSYSSRAGSGTYDLGVAEIVNGSGRVNVWCDDSITYDNAWNNSTYQTQTYWNNVLTWLGQCP